MRTFFKQKKFVGLWATFAYLDDFCDAIQTLRQKGFKDLSTHSPFPRHEIFEALGNPQSRVPFITLGFGAVGVIVAYSMASWMTLDWVLPVSSKPLVSIPPYTIIAFELMILLSAYGTLTGIVVLAARETLKKGFPKSVAYQGYNRFSGDRFGLIVRCSVADFKAVNAVLTKFMAEEIHRENSIDTTTQTTETVQVANATADSENNPTSAHTTTNPSVDS